MTGEMCEYDDIGIMIESTQIATADRKYEKGSFKKLPKDYHIMSFGKEGKKVMHSADFRGVGLFSDTVDVIRPDSDTCKSQSAAKAKKVAEALGLTEGTNFNVRNVEGRKSIVIYPENRVTKYPEHLKNRLDGLVKKKIIDEYTCFPKKGGEVCIVW